jgi:peptide/nickel transport system substrate-binding protein
MQQSYTEEFQSLYLEQLGMGDWAVTADEWSYQLFYTPFEYATGMLADSWETPDDTTIIFHIREGVYWQDKPPVNGREFTADDVVWSFNRILGLGSGFTEPSPYFSLSALQETIESVTATDKYTVVFKHQPSLDLLHGLLTEMEHDLIVPREVVEQYGDANDWRHVVGTGPWILDELQTGTVVKFVKNDNYWGFDERHPENRLPYADELWIYTMPEASTQLAALRAGIIDEISYSSGAALMNWEQAESMRRTNPEITIVPRVETGLGYVLRLDKPPFDELAVRKAMQMALPLKSIAQDYYNGAVDWRPYPLFSPALTGYSTPFDDLPEEVQEGYMYDPEAAIQLLADAGYENGIDTTLEMYISGSTDLELTEICKYYWEQIGVDVDIQLTDLGGYFATTGGGNLKAIGTYWSALLNSPMTSLGWRWGGGSHHNWSGIDDPIFNDLYERAQSAQSFEEQRQLIIQAADYDITNHFIISLLPKNKYAAYQPWLMGFNGEYGLGQRMCGPIYARVWLDLDLRGE